MRERERVKEVNKQKRLKDEEMLLKLKKDTHLALMKIKCFCTRSEITKIGSIEKYLNSFSAK